MSLVFPPAEVVLQDGLSPAQIEAGGVPYVLVVDDQQSVGYLLQRSIEAAGHETRIADSAEMALELIRAQAPLVVVCDVHLPGENGFWLAEQVHTLAPTTAVVLMTGDAHVPIGRWMRQGVIAFLVKPVTRGTLLAVLDDALRWSAEQQDQVARGKRHERMDVRMAETDEPRAGDVLIERRRGGALCSFGLVRQDGLRPARLRSGTLSEARHWAEQMLAGTGGQVRELATT